MFKIEAPDELIQKIVEMADAARKGGFLALEEAEIENEFMQKGVDMLVDGHDIDVVRATMSKDISMTTERHEFGATIYKGMGDVAPAMGMIGTLIGLVAMLGNMSDPKSIGPSMSIALLTTLYGAVLANVICIPISQKLVNQSELEAANAELIIEGALFIQSGGNPRVLTDYLASFVPPKFRAELLEAQ